MRILSVPESRHLYLRRLTENLTRRGLRVSEAPFPYLRWPGNLVRFAGRLLERPDLCHLHWTVFDVAFAAKAFFALRVPKVWTVHNIVPHAPVFRDDLAMTHFYLDHVDVAVWHSQRNLEEARRRFADRGLRTTWHAEDRIIPCMSFNGAWPDTATEAEARRRVGVDGVGFVVGHFAPTLPYKGTRLFLDAISRTSGRDVAFCIFGECHDPQLARDIESAARSRPELKVRLGPLRDDELQYWFKACNVLVQPYTDVTTSGSIGFALAFRRPVIAPPLGNIPDVIEPGVTGWLARSPEEIVACIEEAMEDPRGTAAMGVRAHEAIDRVANVETVVDAYTAAYAAAADHGRGAPRGKP